MKKQELFNNVTEGFPYQRQPQQVGLYDAAYEHDACGVGMLVNIHGEKSHDIVESALKVLENMRHLGAVNQFFAVIFVIAVGRGNNRHVHIRADGKRRQPACGK